MRRKGNNNMKKFITIVGATMLIGTMCALVSGCFTSAKAYTKTTNPDGTVADSYVGVVGTGDKASQVAAEGLFADGAPDAFGAGVKSASASQTSTGIDGTLADLDTIMQSMVQLMAIIQSGGLVAPSVQNGNAETGVAPFTGAVKSAPAASPPKSVINGEGAAEIVILGNRATCSLCNTLWGKLDVASLSEQAGGVNVIDADKTDNAAVYATTRPTGSFSWPYVRIFKDGAVLDEFSARGMNQADIVARAKKVLN
jgi:hypothetical protein